MMERAGQPGRPVAARSCCLRREQLDPTWTEAGLACYRRLRRALNQQSVNTHAESALCMPAHGRRHKLLASAQSTRDARAGPGACRLGCDG